MAKHHLLPRVRAMDEAEQFDPELLQTFFAQGLMGIAWPPDLGGAGGSFFDSVVVVEELSRVDAAAGVIVDVQNTLLNNALLRWGTEAQKQRYGPLLSREWLGAYALSEAQAGSDAFALQTTAQALPGGRYVLNGHKLWITNAREAQLFIVFATLDASRGYRGVTAFLVEKGQDGFQVGRKEEKLGIRASSTCELLLDRCEVGPEQLLGEPGKGYKIAIETLNEGRIGIGAQMLGIAEGALGAANSYVRERKQFGKALTEFQAVQFQLAELHIQVEAARLMVYNAARLRDAALPFVKEAAMAKWFSARVAERVASAAVELLGGNGYVRDYPVEKFYRDAKIGAIYEGTSNMQLQTIAKLVLQGSGKAE